MLDLRNINLSQNRNQWYNISSKQFFYPDKNPIIAPIHRNIYRQYNTKQKQ